MMHINIDVKDTRMIFQQFQYAYHDVIDIAKSRRLVFLRMMKSATPINANVALIVIELLCAFETCTCVPKEEIFM